MKRILFNAFYDGKWYSPALVGGSQVPQVFNNEGSLVNLCTHNEEYYVVQVDKNGKAIAVYGNPYLTSR